MLTKIYKAVVCIILMTSIDCLAETSDIDKAKTVVYQLVASEFNGVPDARANNVLYTPGRLKKEIARDINSRGTTYYWGHNHSILVVEYSIQSARALSSSKFVVYVKFKTVGKTIGDSEFTRDFALQCGNEVLEYAITKRGEAFQIIDPPMPRISTGALAEYYRERVNRMGEKWLTRSDITARQKELYLKFKKDIDVVEKLRCEN